MIKEIFASVLLVTSIGTPIISKDNSASSTSLYGGYCLREYFNQMPSVTTAEYTIYNYQSYTDNAPDIKQYIVNEYDNTYFWSTTRTFTLETYIYNNVQHFGIYLSDSEYVIESGWIFGTDLSDLDTDLNNLIIYFTERFYLEKNAYNLFMCMFTQEGNAEVVNYNGYYSFLNNLNGVNENWYLYGHITANNNLYNYICYIEGDSWANLNGEYQEDIVDNYKLIGSRLVLMNNVLIPKAMQQMMLNTGAFTYVYEPVQYTFADMIFNVVDAPIYMLSQLFSFKLFGVELYVAFTGVLTLLLMMFLVRKMI